MGRSLSVLGRPARRHRRNGERRRTMRSACSSPSMPGGVGSPRPRVGAAGLCHELFRTEGWREAGFSSLDDLVQRLFVDDFAPMDATTCCASAGSGATRTSRARGGDLRAARADHGTDVRDSVLPRHALPGRGLRGRGTPHRGAELRVSRAGRPLRVGDDRGRQDRTLDPRSASCWSRRPARRATFRLVEELVRRWRARLARRAAAAGRGRASVAALASSPASCTVRPTHRVSASAPCTCSRCFRSPSSGAGCDRDLVVSMLVFNYLFLPPTLTFTLSAEENWVGLRVPCLGPGGGRARLARPSACAGR